MLPSVIVCDDSRFARQQLIRSLPAGLAHNLAVASHGEEALHLLRQGLGDLLFLDLNMPGLDGYQVLEAIRAEQLQTMVIVVSGDIQQQAHERILQLGALAFLRKPLASQELLEVLGRYGLYDASAVPAHSAPFQPDEPSANFQESLQEMVNIAMGQAARQLADLLNLFIHLPIPQVRLLSGHGLQQQLQTWLADEGDMVISQGFAGASITGETLIHVPERDVLRIAPLLGLHDDPDDTHQSLLMELASMLSGTLLRGLSDLLGLRFSRSHASRIASADTGQINPLALSGQALAVSLAYTIPAHQIRCTLLLLFTEASVLPMQRRLSLING